MDDRFEEFVQKERIRISPIVAACGLSGEWGDFYGPGPFEFLVDGPPSANCPNCRSSLTSSESTDSGDWNVEFWQSCNACGLVWYDGHERID